MVLVSRLVLPVVEYFRSVRLPALFAGLRVRMDPATLRSLAAAAEVRH